MLTYHNLSGGGGKVAFTLLLNFFGECDRIQPIRSIDFAHVTENGALKLASKRARARVNEPLSLHTHPNAVHEQRVMCNH